ncbi:hypothetical protein [Bacillus bombysepticus]|uniref:hypothetical protein n=1 Tax=Bacillus bombysepticus TaxID=658666 RepID=UPI00301ADCF3
MGRQTWKKENLYITFGKSSITPFDEDKPVKDMAGVMYLYYDISILQNGKLLFRADAYDFPKVEKLPFLIDHLMSFDMEKAYLLEDTAQHGFERRIKYHQVVLDDLFEVEYFYKIERYDYYVKQSSEEQGNTWSEYVLTIGNMEVSKKYGGANRESYGKCIVIKQLTSEDLIRLKEIAENFCAAAIVKYNKYEYLPED